MKVEPVKGTRDFFPEQKFVQDYMFNVWESIAKKFSYENFDGPMLEPAKLWQMKSGDEIPEQMYVLDDKAGRKLAIRPELTPTLARMIAEKQKSIIKPIRWYSIARCWRYEQPQSGRLREFFQLNVDCLGSDSMQLDAEVIATAVEIMKSFDLDEKDFYVRIGNRKLIESMIISSGINKSQLKDVSRLIDKLEKIGEKTFILSLKDLDIEKETAEKLLDLLKIKEIDEIDEDSLDEDGKQGLKEIKELLKLISYYGMKKYAEFDASIMRGFDYYTSTVFEVYDRDKKLRAIAGGGRYDNLVLDFGGEKMPGVGYGMGDVVLELFLKEKKKIPEYRKELDYYVAVLNENCLEYAMKVAIKLREKYKVELEILGRNISKQFNYADKIKAENVIIIGDDEVKNNFVKIKNLKTGKEEEKKVEEL
jgi:histidyl-tRNA synthetase